MNSGDITANFPFRLGKYFILERKTILILLFITEKKDLTLTSSLKALSVHLKLCSSSVDLFGKETDHKFRWCRSKFLWKLFINVAVGAFCR